jgi:hypothetical protein
MPREVQGKGLYLPHQGRQGQERIHRVLRNDWVWQLENGRRAFHIEEAACAKTED